MATTAPPVSTSGIPRKAVGRKPVGGGLNCTPSLASTGSIASSHYPANAQSISQWQAQVVVSPGAAHAQNPGYFDLARQQSASFPQAATGLPTGANSNVAIPSGTPHPQQLDRVTSVRSIDSAISSVSGSAAWPTSPESVVSHQTSITTPPLSRATSGTETRTQDLPTCDQCRAVILPNVSAFHCLICNTGGVATRFCVYCYNTGAAARGHSHHDPSFYVTDSDLMVRAPTNTASGPVGSPPVPTIIWLIRQSATGRIWYQHRATGYRTHLQPYKATVPPPTIPAGWELRTNPDGRKYYYHANTGASSWTLPVSRPLPPGWIEVRTPDRVPFYVHQEHQLSCWERPGDPPLKASGDSSRAHQTKPKKSASSSTAVHGVAAAGAAVTLAGSVASLADAADLSPQGIISATVAAAKLTHHGAKLAGRKMNKLAKSKQIRRASRMFTSAAALAAIGDDGGEGFDIGGEEEQYVEGGTECGEESVGGEEGVYQEQYAEAGHQTGYAPMEPVYEQVAPPPACQAYEYPATQVCPPQEYPNAYPTSEQAVVVNNVYITETSEAQVEQTMMLSTQNTVVVDETYPHPLDQPIQSSQSVEPAPVITVPIYCMPEADVSFASEPIPTQDPAQLEQNDLPPSETHCAGAALEVTQPQDGAVPPLVFEPVLAGPMMVNPPAEQNGVVFAPTYV